MLCFLYLETDATIRRVDVLEREAGDYTPPGRLLGRWRRVVKAPEEEVREQQKQRLVASEEVFLSLFFEEAQPSEEADALKQLLALMLERKRILRAEGRPQDGFQVYLHVPSKQHYRVPMRSLTSEVLAQMQSQLNVLGG